MIHTQEDWKLQNGINVYYIIAKDGDNHVAVALVFPRGIAGCETKGNALLMKAAPKMYEALERISVILANPLTTRTETSLALREVRARDEAWIISREALAEVEGGNDGN